MVDRRKALSNEQEELVVALYISGADTVRHLSFVYDCSQETIRNVLRRRGIEMKTGAKGKRFTSSQEEEIVREYMADYPACSLLACKYGCSVGTIRNILVRHGVAILNVKGFGKKIFDDEKERQIVQEYTKGGSLRHLAKRYGCSHEEIRLILQRNNYDLRSRGKTKIHRRWYGGEWYIRHPETDAYIQEKRFVMEQHLGRKIKRNEEVEHVNGDTNDNRIENLRIVAPKNIVVCWTCGKREKDGGFRLCKRCYNRLYVRHQRRSQLHVQEECPWCKRGG